MPIDLQLESYLAALDKALGPVPASSRAEIVLEIKSHVLDARANAPDLSTKAVLAKLGEPEAVANRYLLERGLKPGKAPRGAVVKWLTLGFLGTVAMLLLATGLILARFQPLVEVDGDNGSVKILGGMISVHDDGEEVEAGTSSLQVDPAKTSALRVELANGKLVVEPSPDAQLHWQCRGRGNGPVEPREEGRTLVLTLTGQRFSRCTVSVPKALSAHVDSSNGKILISRPQGDIDVVLANGKVVLEPDPEKSYSYELRATNGSVDHFDSSDAAGAVKIKVSVANGRIVRDRS